VATIAGTLRLSGGREPGGMQVCLDALSERISTRVDSRGGFTDVRRSLS
jgi:hypothetical protein